MPIQNKPGAGISAAQKKDIEAALKKISLKRTSVQKYIAYYKGEHRLNYAGDKFRTKFGEQLKKFRDNLCRTAVVAPCDRLQINGFADETKAAIYGDAWEIWKYSSMPRFAKRVHKDAFKTGNGYVIVWADESGQARIYPQKAENCCVWYNEETNRVSRGAKLWRDEITRLVYLTLYYSDRIEKFVTLAGYERTGFPSKAESFRLREVEGETPDDLRNESGICPMFHFGLESSILDDVMPINDALNKTICDLLVSSESNSALQRWSTGVSYPIDAETGKKLFPFESGDAYVASEKENARFGEFGLKSLTDFLEVVNDFRMEIARLTGIPAYYFMLEKGSLPSGEALRKSESRFTALVTDAQEDFGETWSQAIAFALWINDKLTADDARAGQIQTNWSPASPTSDNEKVDLANKKLSLGVSKKRLQSEIGYTDADIEQNEIDNQADADAAAQSFEKVFASGEQLIK